MMRKLFTATFFSLAVVLLNASIGVAHAVNLQAYQFDDPEREALFRDLIDELRCPKCQNQALSDSDAPLAKDLRDKTYEMVKAGASKQEVIDFMVARYGDFAHYQPPMKASTSILWWGPALFVVLGVTAISWRVMQLRRRRELEDDEQLSAAEQAQLERLQLELAKQRGTDTERAE